MKNSLSRSSAALLHPVTLTALTLWAINDHLLKGWGPALLTGKLSDVAGLAVCPTVLLGISEWCAPHLVQRHWRSLLIASCTVIGLLVVGLELSEPVQLAYRYALGGARFVAGSLVAGLCGSRAPAFALVSTTPDVTDLLTLPALAIPCWLVRHTQLSSSSPPRVSPRLQNVPAGAAKPASARHWT